MAQTVIGFFDNAAEAQRAVQELVSKGFNQSHIDIAKNTAGSTETTSSTYDQDDSISGFFKSLFTDDDHVNKYATVARSSGSIVTVHAQSGDEAERAAAILDDFGAVDVDERASQYGYSNINSNRTGYINETTADTKIPIIEENLSVGKREVETGGARIRSTIVERPVEETLRLREEHVFVNRTPVNRPASETDFNTFREGQVEVTERAEVPVVAKEARVVEEVSLGKEVSEREETIRDTVRSTEVKVEDLKDRKSVV